MDFGPGQHGWIVTGSGDKNVDSVFARSVATRQSAFEKSRVQLRNPAYEKTTGKTLFSLPSVSRRALLRAQAARCDRIKTRSLRNPRKKTQGQEEARDDGVKKQERLATP